MTAWRCIGTYSGPRRADAFTMHVAAVYADDQHAESYRIYVTDAIRALGRGEYPSMRWADMGREDVGEDIDGEEIVAGLVRAGALEVRDEPA